MKERPNAYTELRAVKLVNCNPVHVLWSFPYLYRRYQFHVTVVSSCIKLIIWNRFIRCAFGIIRHRVNLTVVSDTVSVHICSVRDDRELRGSVVTHAPWISLKIFLIPLITFWYIRACGFHVSCFPLNPYHFAKRCVVLKYRAFHNVLRDYKHL